jgi:tetratricopeptide (TPR) repeat protein
MLHPSSFKCRRGPMRIFISYSHRDKSLCDDFRLHMKALSRVHPVEAWHDGEILAGDEWREEIKDAIYAAQVVVLLVSAGFMASDYVWDKELPHILARHKRGECVVIPVIVKTVDGWQESSFKGLQALPAAGKPVNTFTDQDAAWAEVVAGLKRKAKKAGFLQEQADHTDPFAAPVTSAARLFHVPRPENPFFTGRKKDLAWIKRTLNADNHKRPRPAALLHGTGGVGKSEAAAHYAHQHRDKYQVVWWIDAERPATRDEGFSRLAEALGLPGFNPRDMAQTRVAVLQWMESATGWLLVFDNAETYEDLQPWLPGRPGGHVLVTSRFEAWEFVADVLPVAVWDTPTAAQFLRDRSRDRDTTASQDLAKELGGLPLACEHAAAYVRQSGCGLAGYLRLLAQRFDKAAPVVFRTFTLAMEKAAEQAPLAETVMNLCACLAPEPIPRTLFSGEGGLGVLGEIVASGPHPNPSPAPLTVIPAQAGIQSNSTTSPVALDPGLRRGDEGKAPGDRKEGFEGGEVEPAAPVDEFALNAAFAALRRQALMVGEGELTLHRLVQATARSRLTDRQKWDVAALALVAEAFPDGVKPVDARTWGDCARLRPHAETLLAALPDGATQPDLTGYLCNQLGLYLKERGDYPATLALYERSLKFYETRFGPDDDKTAIVLSNLGALLQSMGRLEEAATHTRRALGIAENTLGPDHPTVANHLSNLATIFNDQQLYQEAEALLRRALEIDQRELGPDHPNIAIDLSMLGASFSGQGKQAEARPLQERALEIARAHYGDDHPTTATALNNLAGTLRALGDAAGAVEMARKALAIWEKWLGPDHHHTQQSRRNLAVAEAALRAKAGNPPPGRERGLTLPYPPAVS